jgi:hypothetical protein
MPGTEISNYHSQLAEQYAKASVEQIKEMRKKKKLRARHGKIHY